MIMGFLSHKGRTSGEMLLKENERSMKKISATEKDELRTEYKMSDFPGGLVRGIIRPTYA
jgi:hypothetical protein